MPRWSLCRTLFGVIEEALRRGPHYVAQTLSVYEGLTWRQVSCTLRG
jgi:hypothetical protein